MQRRNYHYFLVRWEVKDFIHLIRPNPLKMRRTAPLSTLQQTIINALHVISSIVYTTTNPKLVTARERQEKVVKSIYVTTDKKRDRWLLNNEAQNLQMSANWISTILIMENKGKWLSFQNVVTFPHPIFSACHLLNQAEPKSIKTLIHLNCHSISYNRLLIYQKLSLLSLTNSHFPY